MATDITTTLIQMIKARLSPTQANALTTTSAIQNNFADNLSTIANYAQIFGTTVPGAVAIAQGIIGNAGNAAAQSGGTLAEQIAGIQSSLDASAASAAATSALTAGAVIFLTAVVAVFTIAITSGQQSVQDQQFQEIQDIFSTLNQIIAIDLANYWNGKLTTGDLPLLWTSVKADLDDLASQGTGGQNVKNDAPHSHSDAQKFVILLISNPFGSGGYWSVAGQPAGDVPQSSDSKPGFGKWGWEYESWYGQFPIRETAFGPPGADVKDPVTMLPVLALGLLSYMSIESFLYSIDPTTQTPFSQFVSEYRDIELKGYLDFLYQTYQLAVNGIAKTDIPSDQEILGALWWLGQLAGVFAHPSTNPTQPTNYSWGAPEPTTPGQYPQGGTDDPGPALSGNGYSWNRVYGASATYPQYGFYGNYQLDQNKFNLFTPAYIVSFPDATNAVSQWQQSNIIFAAGSELYVSIDAFENWTIPWLQNRIMLGSMARWKAIYLLNGFASVWSMLQAFQRLTGLTDVPTTMRLTQDNTIASGDWSARELCTVVLIRGTLLTGNAYASTNNQFIVASESGHSVGGLLEFLYNIANGNWAGPPQQVRGDQEPPRPLSFRSLLAGAAM
jgi:hypothetical protein